MDTGTVTTVVTQAAAMEYDVAFAYALGSVGPAIAIGMIGMGAVTAIGRNPSAINDIRSTMILTIAFAEAFGIFALVISMLIKFS